MSKKENNKVDLSIDGEDFKQIRIEGKDLMWKNSPKSSNILSGLHIISEHQERNHYDIYKEGKEFDKVKTGERLNGIYVNKRKGNFAVSSNQIIVLNGDKEELTLISPEYYISHSLDYRVVIKDYNGEAKVVARIHS